MTHINIKISKAAATAEKDGIITTGMVGVPVSFMFDSWWDGLIVTAVFKGSGAPISVPLLGATETVVPWEVLKRPSTLLRIGAEGRLPDGTLVIPTTWATVGIIMSGANATDDLAKPPTPTAFDRIMSQIGNMNDLTTEEKNNLVAAINEAMTKGGVDTEEVWRIVGEYLASNPPTITESDPTVPEWAKEAQKPSYTASEVGADPSGTAVSQVAAHNTGTDTHSDIRLLIQGLTDKLNALADSDDTTLDQLSEVVAYIKSNRSLIEAITTSKVSVADIVDNLTTNVSNKPLSAAQGVAIKAMIDAITVPEALPNPNALTFTGAVTGSYDGTAPMTVKIPTAPTKTSQLTNDSGFLTSHQDISGKQDRATLEADVAAKGFTKNTGTYSKPAGGIPKADLAAAVQTSLGKADTALQEHQSLAAYRTAAAQDEIDSGKVDKVTGKGLSTNDYTAAAKAKVDAIPANPKYTDTVYDDTALKERVATIEGKESAWDAKLNASELPTAINTALAQAKASGEFDGADGKSAYQYAVEGGYTGSEAEFAAKLAQEMPDKLPNPNALTFTGAVSATYDGSEPLTVEIPSGGDGSTGHNITITKLASGTIPSGTDPVATHTGITFGQLNGYKRVSIVVTNPSVKTGSDWTIVHNTDTTGWKIIALTSQRGYVELRKVADHIWDALFKTNTNASHGLSSSPYAPYLTNNTGYAAGTFMFNFTSTQDDEICIYNKSKTTADASWAIHGMDF